MLLKYLKRRNRKTDSQMADALCLTITHYKKLEKEGWSCKPSNDPSESYILYYDEKAIKYESYKPLKRWRSKTQSKTKEVVSEKIKYKRIERPRLKLIEKIEEYGFTLQYLAENVNMNDEYINRVINKGSSFSFVLFYKLWVLFGGDLSEDDCLFENEQFIKNKGFAKYLLKEGYIEDNGWEEIFCNKSKGIVKNKNVGGKTYWNQVWG